MPHLFKYLNYLSFYLAATMILAPSVLLANSGGTASSGNGDRTGSPLAGGTCAVCHSGGSFGSVEAVISVVDVSGMPVTSFVAAETYMITVEVTNSAGTPTAYGFQLTLLDSNNEFIGTFSTPSVDSGLVSQSNQDFWETTASSSLNTFTVLWDAPVATTTVGIYATALAVNGTGSTSGDVSSLGASFVAELSLPAEWIFASGFE